MTVLEALDVLSDRAFRIAKIIRESQKANVIVNQGDPDIEVRLNAAQKADIRQRINDGTLPGVVVNLQQDLRDAIATLPPGTL